MNSRIEPLDWKKIWLRKGKEPTNDLLVLNGYENRNISPSYVAKKIQDTLGFNQNSSVLEVGCGSGMIAQYYDCNYGGVDYSETLVKKHIDILGNTVYVADADKLPFPDKSFDYVFSMSVFHYFPNADYVKRAISEMSRVARKNIFIGDLPMSSHDDNHLLFSKSDFYDWSTSDGYYNKERFNVFRSATVGQVSE